ncbi:Membrane fusion protein Use1 [Striga hermonthica]|uniref:Membrane fusion protein Use1 n=1 Tax=Striga hermonthica TaxID=68872 RepID=A0A9N7NT12_STRHE|nr:Membrane fusion protein Use1 [Striga hermonthica]
MLRQIRNLAPSDFWSPICARIRPSQTHLRLSRVVLGRLRNRNSESRLDCSLRNSDRLSSSRSPLHITFTSDGLLHRLTFTASPTRLHGFTDSPSLLNRKPRPGTWEFTLEFRSPPSPAHLHGFTESPSPSAVPRPKDSAMRFSKTEVNLRRLLAAAPQQHNQAKLVHYVATLRELLEQLAEERISEGLPRVSKGQLNEYSEKIEAIAAKLVATECSTQFPEEPSLDSKVLEPPSVSAEGVSSPRGLRRRFVPPSSERATPNTVEDSPKSVKLDAAAQGHIEKHRKLQEDLTDEMVGLARQLKESSLRMNGSIKNTEKILDSTEKAVEHSLASTGHANTRAAEVFSQSMKTSCFTWLLIFVMTCIFVMVVLLIRVT